MVLLCAVASEGGLSVYEVRLNGTCVASLDPAGESALTARARPLLRCTGGRAASTAAQARR